MPMTHTVKLKAALPAELTDEFAKRICYISEAIAKYEVVPGNPQEVRFELNGDFAGSANSIGEQIQAAAEKMSAGYRAQTFRTVQSGEGTGRYTGDPHPLLKETGELYEYGDGRFGLGPKLCSLATAFQKDIDGIAAEMRASERQFPTLLGADVMDKCQYIRSFPSSLTIVQHLREDAQAIAEFAGASWNGKSLDCNTASLSVVRALLSPNVCFHWYAWLSGQKLPEPTTVTATGKCARYESKNMKGLERLWDFTMREIIFAGSGKFVLQQRDRGIEMLRPVMEKWGLKYDITTATDPFFINDFAAKASFQLAFELKFELLVPLPYRAGKKLAAGSFNYHQDFFGKAFDFSLEGKAAHTGCIGFGLERVLLGFVAQHGPDSRNWPKVIA